MVKYRIIDVTGPARSAATCPKCGLELTSGKCTNGACDNFDRYPRILAFPMPGAINNEGLSLEEGNDFV